MGDENAWINFTEDHIYGTCDRLKGVEIYHEDALKIISKHADEKTLFFVDPPYLKSTRVAKNAYLHEVDEIHHVCLLSKLDTYPGRMYLCGYNSKLYEESLRPDQEGSEWKSITFSRPSDAGRTKVKTRRIEHLWIRK